MRGRKKAGQKRGDGKENPTGHLGGHRRVGSLSRHSPLEQKSNYSGLKKCPDRFHWGANLHIKLTENQRKGLSQNKKKIHY